MIGKQFGRWIVIKEGPRSKNGYKTYQCKCECGTKRLVLKRNLLTGLSKSCGCYGRSMLRPGANFRHGHAKVGKFTRAYRAWHGAKGRCLNPRNRAYAQYGGRGISISERWQQSFNNFLEDMGEPPPNTSLDRIDNNGNYEPGNCRWATRAEQMHNTRRALMMTINGETLHITEWAKRSGLTYGLLKLRLRFHCPPEKFLLPSIQSKIHI